jgi:hypothetical protein
MHAVPANLDLGRLIGQDLTQICIGKFYMQIYFARPTADFPTTPSDEIECEGTVMADFGGLTTLIFDAHPGLLVGATPEDAIAWRDASILPSVVGETVTDWRVEGSHEFSITLSNGTKLRFQSHDSPYEDFVIFGGEWVI